MNKLTKKYIFKCKLKDESIKIWIKSYDDKLCSWDKDLALLHKCGILTIWAQRFYKIQHNIQVIYHAAPGRRAGFTHTLRRGATLSVDHDLR